MFCCVFQLPGTPGGSQGFPRGNCAKRGPIEDRTEKAPESSIWETQNTHLGALIFLGFPGSLAEAVVLVFYSAFSLYKAVVLVFYSALELPNAVLLVFCSAFKPPETPGKQFC